MNPNCFLSVVFGPFLSRFVNLMFLGANGFTHRPKAADFPASAGVHQVSIRLDLETVFQFSHLVLKFKVRI